MISIIYGLVAVIAAALIAFTITPPVRVFAYKIGAIDVPKDGRRMHKKPIPRIGGLAIFTGFVIASMIFCDISRELVTIWFGGFILIVLGILDDVYRLNAWIKLAVQIAVAVIAVTQGIVINHISIGETYLQLGFWKYPITVLWIVGLTNAINLIDGLDGLACGVSAICSIAIFTVTLIMGDYESAMITAILTGACIGFLPYNRTPARIFMGDTGALFLGFALAIISVQGLFKVNAAISFLAPLSIFALPLFDTMFAIIRRVIHGHSPFHPDRGHLHHKLIDMGFTQKESVTILYAICGLLGLVAVTFTDEVFNTSKYIKSFIIVVVAIAIFLLNFFIMKNPKLRSRSGLFTDEHADEISAAIEAELDAGSESDDGNASSEINEENS